MLRRALLLASVVLLLIAKASSGQAPSGYAAETGRELKALSAAEIQGYLEGKGMGFAKSAELNGYPGPLHVLEHAEDLGLTAEQRRATEELFRTMQRNAKALGAELIAQERELERLFAGQTATVEAMRPVLRKIGSLQAELRSAHLEAHLAQTKVLTPEQIARYGELRGYAASDPHAGHTGHHP